MKKALVLVFLFIGCATDKGTAPIVPPPPPPTPTISLVVPSTATNGDTIPVQVKAANSTICSFEAVGATLIEVTDCQDFKAALTQEGTATITGTIYSSARVVAGSDAKTIAVAHRVLPSITLAPSNASLNTTGHVYDLRFSVSDVDACNVTFDRTVSGDVLTPVDSCTHWTFAATQPGNVVFTVAGTKAGKNATASKQIQVLLPPTASILGSNLVATLNRSLTVMFDVKNAKNCSMSIDTIPTYGVAFGVPSRWTQFGCDSVQLSPGSTFPTAGRTINIRLFASNGDLSADVSSRQTLTLVMPTFHVDEYFSDPTPITSTGRFIQHFKCNDGCFVAPNGLGNPLIPQTTNFFGILIATDEDTESLLTVIYLGPSEIAIVLQTGGFPPGSHYVRFWIDHQSVGTVPFSVVP